MVKEDEWWLLENALEVQQGASKYFCNIFLSMSPLVQLNENVGVIAARKAVEGIAFEWDEVGIVPAAQFDIRFKGGTTASLQGLAIQRLRCWEYKNGVGSGKKMFVLEENSREDIKKLHGTSVWHDPVAAGQV